MDIEEIKDAIEDLDDDEFFDLLDWLAANVSEEETESEED